MRIIVVDDELIILKAFCRVCAPLENISFIGTFQDPEKALAFIDSQVVDIIFLDVGMPIINGMELAERLFRIRPEIKICFLVTDENELADRFEEKNCRFLLKPFKTSEIEAILRYFEKEAIN